VRPVTKKYRENATGVSEKSYEAKRTHIKIGATISSLSIPFTVAGFISHEPRVLNSVAVAVGVGTTVMGCYLLKRGETKRQNKAIKLLRRDADSGNETAAEELQFYSPG
jgi:hypothetical protein